MVFRGTIIQLVKINVQDAMIEAIHLCLGEFFYWTFLHMNQLKVVEHILWKDKVDKIFILL